MPEGPEVHHMGRLLRRAAAARAAAAAAAAAASFADDADGPMDAADVLVATAATEAAADIRTWGKHLYIDGQDWSFGLTGNVQLDPVTGRPVKVAVGRVHGHVLLGAASYGVGVDFCTANVAQLQSAVARFYLGSRKALGPLLLDQTLVAGIGVAWGSEVLAVAGLRPDKPALAQDLRGLPGAMVAVRDQALSTYADRVHDVGAGFPDFYLVRHMAVYNKGVPVMVSGRQWWLGCGHAS